MIKTVLFDLDGTLIGMDLDRFVKVYFDAVVDRLWSRLSGGLSRDQVYVHDPPSPSNKQALIIISIIECLLCNRHYALTVDKNTCSGTRLLGAHPIQHSLSTGHSASLCYAFPVWCMHVTVSSYFIGNVVKVP